MGANLQTKFGMLNRIGWCQDVASSFVLVIATMETFKIVLE